MDDVNNNELDRLRRKIDQIDQALLELFTQRMQTVIEVAEYKQLHKLPILDESREKLKIENTRKIINPKLVQPALEFLKTVMNISKDLQVAVNDQHNILNDQDVLARGEVPLREGVTVGFQGLPGSYSEQALLEYFGESVQKKNVESFEDVFRALEADEIAYGILPIENSFTGGISEVYDLLCLYGFNIVGEKCLQIDHNLLAAKGVSLDEIKEVYSHPQALLQCSKYLQSYPRWQAVACSNTAVSAKLVADCQSNSKAAIASKRAASLYELEVLAEGINNNAANFTRFIIIGKGMECHRDCDKISLAVAISHEPGSLYGILSHFARKGLNMIKIESRPIADKPWEYLFYIDFEGNLQDKVMKEAIIGIQGDSVFFQLLGNYQSHKII